MKTIKTCPTVSTPNTPIKTIKRLGSPPTSSDIVQRPIVPKQKSGVGMIPPPPPTSTQTSNTISDEVNSRRLIFEKQFVDFTCILTL